MRAQDITRRLTGISTPLVGLSWTSTEPESLAARRIISFLEDRRVLYNPTSLEAPAHCAESVLRIREQITQEIGKLSPNSELTLPLKAIRAACRKFLDRMSEDPRILVYGSQPGHYASWSFLPAIGEMRSEIGTQVACIASAFQIDVDDELASTFPASIDDD